MRALWTILALSPPLAAQTVTIPDVTLAQYIAPALLDVATGQLHATPSNPVTLACTGVSPTPTPGAFAHIGPHYIPLRSASPSPVAGVFKIDGITYQAGPSPVEIDANGFTVIPDPGFTQCRRANGDPLPPTTAVVFYGPNDEVMFLNLSFAVTYDTTTTPHALVMRSSSGDAVCTPIVPPAMCCFADGFEG